MAAFAIFFIILVIAGVGLYSIAFNVAVDEIITQTNPFITAGELSTEWAGYWNFAIGLLVALPFLAMIALTIWSMVRAISRRNGESGVSPSSLWNGITAAFLGIIFSIIMLLALGLGAEGMMIAFETSNVSSTGTIFDVAAPWDTGYDDASYWMSLLYVVCISPSLLGIIIMFLSAIRTQDYDVFSEGGADQYDTGGYGGQAIPQNITAEEIAFQQGLK